VDIGRGKSQKAHALEGRVVAEDIVDPDTGEILLETNEEITLEKIKDLGTAGVKKIKFFQISHQEEADVIRNTIRRDSSTDEEDALSRIYVLLRPGEPPRADTAREILNRLFFNPKRYDLAKVGRFKLNKKLNHQELHGGASRLAQLGLTVPDDELTTLAPEDFVAIIQYLLMLRVGHPDVTTDDIDHLGNRRVRSVGELLSNQFNIGLTRMARIIRERMSLQDSENITPYDLVNARTISAVVQSFFGSSQLSQFMDQTNPLAELTHKRRLSALGPGGLTRDRAGFEVRDVHYTHYGRMCPIETPEGPNIGLISSLATYARVNEFGFLETPYRRVRGGKTSKDDIEFISADVEDRSRIAQANEELAKNGNFVNDRLIVRHRGEFPVVDSKDVDYLDLAPMQIVSPAAALIPFLEHDDANRALMGSNMQRQAVPLLKTDAPIVGTGLEVKVARDSGTIVAAVRPGTVESVSAEVVVVKYDRPKGERKIVDFSESSGLDIYALTKFKRSNQDTCINQRPLVREGARVETKDVLAGPGQERACGLHALGGIQLRGRHPGERASHQGRRLHLDPHRGVRAPGSRYQPRGRGDHAGDPECGRGGGQESGRGRHHPGRSPGPGWRHPGRKGDAQGRNRSLAGGAPAPGYLRGESGRCP
jgi:DNA-directed RNA polymerase subunit beta